MSANFYDTTGVMLGGDPHKFWILGLAGAPVPSMAGYVCAAQFYLNPADDPATKTATLTSDGKRMIQGKCKFTYIPHWPVFILGAPHPVMEPVEIGIIFLFSSSVPVLQRQTVTGEGKPMAVCIYSAIGLNLDCAEPVKTPTGAVVNINSVKTEPSWTDVLPTFADWLLDVVAGKLADRIIKPLQKRIKKVWDILPEPVKRAIEKKAKDFVKSKLKDVMKVVKDKVKPQKWLKDKGIPFL